MNQSPEIMKISDVAEYLRIPLSSAYKLAQEGQIPARKVGRHWRVHIEALVIWLRRVESEPAPRDRSGS